MTINPISEQVQTLEKEYVAALKSLPEVTSLEGAAELHTKVYAAYCAVFKKIELLPRDQKSNHVLEISRIENDAKDLLSIFTNTLLTKFPTAKIEYAPKGTLKPTFVGKKTALTKDQFTENANVSHKRTILGDGNCFLYAFLLRFLEVAIEKEKLPTYIERIKNDLNLEEGLKSQILSSLKAINEDPSLLEIVLNEPHHILPLIYYLKQIAARVISKNPELLMAISTNDSCQENESLKSLEELLEKKVLWMGTQLSQPLILALCKEFDFPISIVSPQRDFPFVNAQFIPGNSEDRQHKATLLLKDEHYSVLYSDEKITTQPPEDPFASIEIQLIPQVIPKPTSSPTYFQIFCRPFQWIWSKVLSLFSRFNLKTPVGGNTLAQTP